MTDWTAAACLPHDPTLWDEPARLPGRGHRDRLPTHARERLAKARVICRQCPVRLACADDAVESADTGVIRGGMTTVERESWRRRREAS